jgi:hypothetical protein
VINVSPQQVEEFVTCRLRDFQARTGLDLAVSGSKIERDSEVVVYVRPHDHNLTSEAFVGEFALIEEAAEHEFTGLSVMLVPDYAGD